MKKILLISMVFFMGLSLYAQAPVPSPTTLSTMILTAQREAEQSVIESERALEAAAPAAYKAYVASLRTRNQVQALVQAYNASQAAAAKPAEDAKKDEKK